MAVGYTTSRKYTLTHQTPLRFGKDGKFRILHLTDIHKVCPEMDDDTDRSIPDRNSKNTLNTIEMCIEKTNPDLVVFGGDNIGGHWDEMTEEFEKKCIDDITAVIRKKNIPLAVVFGNHDAQNEINLPFLSRESQMGLYMLYDNFRCCLNEADIYGCGNCHIPVFANESDEIKWNIWCIDSNDYPRNERHEVCEDCYDCVHADQIAWYESVVSAEREKYGRTIPAVLFQHIPVQQEYDFIEECRQDISDYEAGGKFYRAKPGELKEGLLRECPCPHPRDRAQFDSWVKCGDVRAAFFGHDHTNTFRFDKNGISLYQTIGCGYESYGKERGGRLIILSDDGKTIETQTIIIDKKY